MTITTHSRRALLALLVACAHLAAACGAEPPPVLEQPATSTVAATATAAPALPSAVASPQGPRVIETVVPSTESSLQLTRVEDSVSRLRGRALTQPVTKTFVTSAGMRALIDEELEDAEAVEQIRREGLLLEALGLLPAGTDLLEAYRSLLGGQVLGLYSPEKGALFVLANAQPGPVELATYAHEYQHALQDQRFDLEAVDRATKDNRDAMLAASALIEGDATFTQSQYVAQDLGQAGAFALLGAAAAAPRPSAPAVLLDLLQFPYLQGLNFVQALASGGAGVGAIDAAFARLPASTEQILHVEKFRAREAPVEVSFETPLPEGWTRIGSDVLGEYLLRRWLRETGLQPPSATTAAAGWGGDRYVLASGPNGGVGLVARLAWDTPEDADEFAAVLVPGPPAEGLRLASAGRRWIGIVRLDARTIALAVGGDRPAAEALGRAAAVR